MSHRPKRSLGQNFLRDHSVVDKIVWKLHLSGDDLVIEIGPGRGALTQRILENGSRLIAVEFDRHLVTELTSRFATCEHFELVNADVLQVDLSAVVRERGRANAKLVANLPYNISTPILQALIAHRHAFSEMVLMFQREVVERITAKAGDTERGFLTVLVENAFRAERLFDVAPDAFYPRPGVWSSVVRLIPVEALVPDEALLRRVVSAAFGQRRKTLQNNLKSLFKDASHLLLSAGVEPGRRAQTLTILEWAAIVATAQRETTG